MAQASSEQIFTFVAVRADGTMPVLEIAPCLSEAEARERAASWLSTHPTCERVEIWSESAFVGVAPASPAPSSDRTAQSAMPAYRFFLLDFRGHFRGAEVIEAESRDLAVQKAEELMAQHAAPGYELWQGPTCVARRLDEGSTGA